MPTCPSEEKILELSVTLSYLTYNSKNECVCIYIILITKFRGLERDCLVCICIEVSMTKVDN